MGRWINRDPIEESGGFNLYCFVYNQPIIHYDVLGNAIETIWDVISLGAGVVELVVAPSWVAAGAVLMDVGATVIPGLPGGAGVSLRMARLGKRAANAVKVTEGTAKISGAAHKIKLAKATAQTTTACAKATIVLQKMPYKQLFTIKQKLGLGGKWEAHHIIEKRLWKAFGEISEKATDNWMAVALDKSKHLEITKRWRNAIPKGLDDSTLSRTQVLRIAKEKVYHDMPEILQNLPRIP